MTVLVSVVNHMIKLGSPIRAVACASPATPLSALGCLRCGGGIPAHHFAAAR
jgi:hypothetical protein